jgi:16S rRNA (cytosine1402-N4)-methyltransferase
MRHVPVLLLPVLDALCLEPGAVVVDCTLGGGGHAEAILQQIGPRGRLIGLDLDPDALRLATARLAGFGTAFEPVHADYRDLARVLADLGRRAVDGILADLGVSSMQLDDPARGFSITHDGPLDMRLDPTAGRTAQELLAAINEADLARLLRAFGEEPQARPIARAIVAARGRGPISSTCQLAGIVARAARWRTASRIHPATRTFMALRIAVNDELGGLDGFVRDAVALLRPGGRLCVISFHSLEDRAIKTAFRSLQPHCICPRGLPVCACGQPGVLEILTARPVGPSAEEIADNPRSRSAKLRVAEAR